MKTPLALLFIAIVVIAAFLLGRGKDGDVRKSEVANAQASTPVQTSANVKSMVKKRVGPDVLTLEQASALSHEERIDLLKKAAVLADPEKQADILCGLLSVMTEEQLLEATRTLLDAQRKGNAWSQDTWNALWTQWGRVDPEACLALSKTGKPYPGWNGLNGLNTPDDYRCLMAGWMEADPAKALAWAREPKDNFREATGAAFAITSSANGDLKKMEEAILTLPGDDLTMQACFQDYFDLAVSNGEKPASMYEGMSARMREAAWPEVVSRLGTASPEEAFAWYDQHGKDPGSNDRTAAEMIFGFAEKNPEDTMAWASNIKEDFTIEGFTGHPAMLIYNVWMMHDQGAANAWLEKQPATTPWIARMRAGQSGD